MIKNEIIIGRIIIIIILLFAIAASISGVYQFCKWPEKFSPLARADMIAALESDDEEALNDYIDRYIDNDQYILNGPLTFHLMCEKYNLDETSYKKLYEDGGYSSIQEFFNKIVKDII